MGGETFWGLWCCNHAMTDERDTDTLDPRPAAGDSLRDAPTVRQDFAGSDAETGWLGPRAIAPLRVCPECSLAWEAAGSWCPSCGTAFEKSLREDEGATRVMPTRKQSEPPLTRSARRRMRSDPHAGRPAPAAQPAAQTAAPRAAAGPSLKGPLLAALVAIAILAAFMVGRATRPSDAQIDGRIGEAVQTAKRSAASSYERAFEKMQAQAAAAIEQAQKKGRAEGRAQAQEQLDAQQRDSRGIFDGVTQCVLHGEC